MRRGKEGVGKGRDTQKCRFMEKRVREISSFFVAPRSEFAPAVCARPRTPFSINTSTLVEFECCYIVTHAAFPPWPSKMMKEDGLHWCGAKVEYSS